jgi:hypothetical protein
MMVRRLMLATLLLANSSNAQAGSAWDGVWAGKMNEEPVSITIVGGRVTGYTIRGLMPLPIQSANVSGRSVSLVIGEAYRVRLTKRGEKACMAIAHGPLGDGTASLVRQ